MFRDFEKKTTAMGHHGTDGSAETVILCENSVFRTVTAMFLYQTLQV